MVSLRFFYGGQLIFPPFLLLDIAWTGRIALKVLTLTFH